jgi:lipopolysaccharide/colanic/teichoic acid biosynthesis glycosyltransferase
MNIISRLIAFFLIITLFPIFIFTSIICLATQGRPVLFKQKRIGYNFCSFNILKFRSMKDKPGHLVTLSDDKRITYFGKFIRKTKIDEIPQLFNILLGDMRFIGPRPEIPEYFDKNKFRFLKKIKPGISDFCSILLRNEEDILLNIGGENPYQKILPFKIQLADYYSRNKSFLLDLNLVTITIISIFLPSYASNLFIIPKIKKNLPDSMPFIEKYVQY